MTEAVRIALLTAVLCGVVVTVVFVACRDFLVGLFIDKDNVAARIAIEGFPYFAIGFVCFIFNLTAVGYYQSVEQARPATWFALLRGFIFLVPSFLILPDLLGIEGIWLALPLSEIVTTVVIIVFYHYRKEND